MCKLKWKITHEFFVKFKHHLMTSWYKSFNLKQIVSILNDFVLEISEKISLKVLAVFLAMLNSASLPNTLNTLRAHLSRAYSFIKISRKTNVSYPFLSFPKNFEYILNDWALNKRHCKSFHSNIQKGPPEVFHKKSVCNFIKETSVQLFSCEFLEIFKKNFFVIHIRTIASELYIFLDHQ